MRTDAIRQQAGTDDLTAASRALRTNEHRVLQNGPTSAKTLHSEKKYADDGSDSIRLVG
jgi:hypothetical protein